MRTAWTTQAGDSDDEEGAEDGAILGPGLGPDAVGPHHVAAHDGPGDADQEEQAGGVTDELVALVHLAVEELGAVGELVVDLEDRRHREEDEEREVDQRVHDPRGGVPEQGLHVQAGSEVARVAA